MMHLINHPEAQTIEIREGRRGFWMAFRNGWGISVQWGTTNYCDGTGKNAEIAVLLPESRQKENYLPVPSGGLLCDLSGMSEVWGHLVDYEVLRAMTIVSGFDPEATDDEAYRTFVREMAFGSTAAGFSVYRALRGRPRHAGDAPAHVVG